MLSGVGRFANDQWVKPNCEIRKQDIDDVPYLFLFAKCDIEPEVELRYNYGRKTAPWRYNVHVLLSVNLL